MDYIVKFFLFAVWVGLLYYFVSSVKDALLGYFNNISFVPLLDKLGIIDGVNLFLSVLISCFIAKQILDFWKSA